jgi:cell division protein FtsN
MDVGYFISELLGQHGDVSVPGLGRFAHTRVNGYYNDSEEKFYPPGYAVQFDPQFVDDDTLPQYIAHSKNISLASSKYFTEKYVANLKQQATTSEVPIANLGWFYTKDFKLIFRPNNELNTDPEFFGYPAIKMHKLNPAAKMHELGKQPAITQPDDNFTATINYQPEKVREQFKINDEQEAYLIELTTKRRRKNIILFIGLAALLTGLFYYLYNKYDRSVFNLDESTTKPKTDSIAEPKNVTVVQDSTGANLGDTVKIVKLDSAKKELTPQKDTVAAKAVNTVPPVVKDTVNGPHYEILGGSFGNVIEANTAIRNYKKLGFEAHILENVPGRKRKVTLGSYATRAEAVAAQQKILATGKIKTSSIYIQPYNIK